MCINERADKGEQHFPNMKQAPGQHPVLSPSGKMEPKSLFSLHKALAQPVKMCMFDFPVSILDDLVRVRLQLFRSDSPGVSWCLCVLVFSFSISMGSPCILLVFMHVGLEPVRTLSDGLSFLVKACQFLLFLIIKRVTTNR